jgi:Ca2+-binding RTX toxin-like protein
MPANLTSLTTALSLDPGLLANVSAADLQGGLLAADRMNALLLQVIAAASLNADGRITAADMQIIFERVRANPADYTTFLDAHGDDEGNVETAFHLIQNDGGSLQFRGRDFVDTVADAIYHYGFEIVDGRYVNEDGNANELARDVAGWLNFFLNGVSAVYGTDDNETLNSGTYSEAFAAARNEAFYGGLGNDSIWADLGNDTIFGGAGNDHSGGGFGQDVMHGEAGNDRLSGEAGNDSLYGGDGNDTLGGGADADWMLGGAGNDTLWGETGNDTLVGEAGNDELGAGDGNDYVRGDAGNDTVYGETGDDILAGSEGDDVLGGGRGMDWLQGDAGNDRLQGDEAWDRLFGGAGNDTLGGGADGDSVYGGDGNDMVHGDDGADRLWADAGDDNVYGGNGHDVAYGGAGNDTMNGSDGWDVLWGDAGNDSLSAGEGGDHLLGGAGRDVITLWENMQMRDTIYFSPGDSGRTLATIDRVEGFESGVDRIDLRAFGQMTMEDIDFSGAGASFYYDGRFLRIDANGDRATDMMVEFAWVDAFVMSDFVLA